MWGDEVAVKAAEKTEASVPTSAAVNFLFRILYRGEGAKHNVKLATKHERMVSRRVRCLDEGETDGGANKGSTHVFASILLRSETYIYVYGGSPEHKNPIQRKG